MPTIVTPVVTQSLTEVRSVQVQKVGTVVDLDDGGSAIYVQALSEISAFAYALVDGTGKAQMATTALSGANKRGGWAQTSIPSAFFGWVQTGGFPLGNLAASCAPNVPLYTTSTSGVLDDATVSGGLILGATATVSISNATAVTCLVARGQMVGTGALPA